MDTKKIIKRSIEKIYIFKLKKQERKIIKKHKEWKKLTKVEKSSVLKENKNISIVMKNLYENWDSCNYTQFISDYYYQIKVIPKLNCINYNEYGLRHKNSYFSDKNYQEKFLDNVTFPKAVIRCINGDYYDSMYNIISKDKALKLLKRYSKLVFKKSLGIGHGKGVKLVDNKNYEEELIKFNNNFIVQEILQQNDALAYFNSSSVNIIRVTSLYWKGQVYILSGILRVGAPGAFCDHLGYGSVNPRVIALDENGNLIGKAVDPDDCIVYDDIFGKKIEGKIPMYNEIKDIVKREHIKFKHHKIIGWDFTIDNKNNIICIEYNSTVPGIIQTQMVCGPVFSQKTANGSTLLNEIVNNK